MTDQSLPISPDSPPPPEGSRYAKAHHILLMFVGFVLLVWLLSGIYQVNNDQVAIVERLGAYVSNNQGKAILVDPGLHYALPWPIDTIHKISLQQRRTLQVKAFNQAADANAGFKRDFANRTNYPMDFINSLFDPYIITGDENVLHVELAVQYVVDDPEAWLNTVSHATQDSDNSPGNREELFQEIAQHALTSQLAKLDVDTILFSGQSQLPPILLQAMDHDLNFHDPYDPTKNFHLMGVHIHSVDLVAARPPDRVKDDFNNVGKAISDAEAARAQGRSIANSAVTKANADKDTLILDAQAYAAQVTNAAEGEAKRFAQILTEYEKSPDITRWNVYVEAVRTVSANANRIFFAQPGTTTTLRIDPPQFDAKQPAPR